MTSTMKVLMVAVFLAASVIVYLNMHKTSDAVAPAATTVTTTPSAAAAPK